MRETSTYLNAKSDRRSVDEMQLHKFGIFVHTRQLFDLFHSTLADLSAYNIKTVGNAHNAE